MLTNFELTITKDYAPKWTVVDAVREFFQNALDQQTVDNTNMMFFDYQEGKLILGNKSSILDTKSLLLGSTSKANDEDTIGQFGEGYKIATLVLSREGKRVTIYNYGKKEVWYSNIAYSRKYKTELLIFSVDKKYPWQNVPDNNLTIVIEGITEEEYSLIVDSNLHLQEIYKSFKTSKGEILTNHNHVGKIFVNGLFVSKLDTLRYGYNFKPKMINLDRDRRLVEEFDLKWTTAQLWLESGEVELIEELIEYKAKDVEYIVDSYDYGIYDKLYKTRLNLSTKITESFISEHGNKAVPVYTQSQFENVPSNYKAVLVSENKARLITMNEKYVEPVVQYKPTFLDNVESWLDKYEKNIKRDARRELRELIKGEKEMKY